jgi:hypothetical protein
MKFIKLLTITFILGFTAQTFATECSYDVRGYDMSEGMLKVGFEDSFDDQNFNDTPFKCVSLAVVSLKNHEMVPFKVKGKTFASWPAGLHVIIEIASMTPSEIDIINNWFLTDPNLSVKKAFEHVSDNFTADIGFVRQIAEANK